MRRFYAIFCRELAAAFLSPVAYVTMVACFALVGVIFWYAVVANVGGNEPLSSMLFAGVIFCMTFLVTVVSMRLFAEEKRLGTIEALMTAPVTEAEIVAGKYVGALVFLLAVVTIPVGFVFILRAVSPGIDFVDVGALIGGYIITVSLTAFTLSVGLFVSLTTRNQIVAAITCLCAVWLVLLAGNLASAISPGPTQLSAYLSTMDHVAAFTHGSVDTRPIVLYVSGTLLMLFASVRVLESMRWK